MHSHTIKEAARLAEASYKRKRRAHRKIREDAHDILNDKDVQAFYMKNGVLLIMGSNSLMDYVRYNLRLLRLGTTQYKMSDDTTEDDAKGITWHQGFLAHAKIIQQWIEKNHEIPKFIIGHFLGAAATQILCKDWKVPGIAFAAPRPHKYQDNSDLCLCINRHDDLVTKLPTNFHHMGKMVTCKSRSSLFRSKHPMKHYRTAVAERQKLGLLAKSWP
tara:strand:- start:324 stop:974 length:651 start_codon:yes stop_codon:yes gene_type:complete